MKKFLFARCPICGYVWVKRIERPPKQCQRCKYPFNYPGHEASQLFSITFSSHKQATEWANKATEISPECKDVKELLNKMLESKEP